MCITNSSFYASELSDMTSLVINYHLVEKTFQISQLLRDLLFSVYLYNIETHSKYLSF